jgi:hypothetical protein
MEMKYAKLSGIMAVAALAALTAFPLEGAEQKKPVPPPHGHGRPAMRGSKRNAMVWRVFSQLSEAERKKMAELQRNNPEAFNAEMRKLVEQFEQQERARTKHLQSLIDRYRKSTDEKERAALKAELAKMETERFEKRLEGFAKMIAGTRKRLAIMEQDLEKRKARKGAIVEARVEALLSGEIPVIPAHNGHPPMRKGPRPFMRGGK